MKRAILTVFAGFFLISCIGAFQRVAAAEKHGTPARVGNAENTESGGQNTTVPREIISRTMFTLVFTGFTPEDITGIEEYLVAFGGYRHHQSLRSSPRRVEYQYETSSDGARLNRNMRLMLDRLGVDGSVNFSNSNNTLTVEKNRTPPWRWPARE